MSRFELRETAQADLPEDLRRDVQLAGDLPSVRIFLDIICRTTGMGFATVARVTPERWVACAVHDDIAFGLKPGGELQIETTICQNIQQFGDPVVIPNVSRDPFYCSHNTPSIYGFQSYISVPIRQKNGRFFGTLCAIDPEPKPIDNADTRSMFYLFADLIGSQLDSAIDAAEIQSQISDALATGELRDQLVAILGHDLGNPLADVTSSAEQLDRFYLGKNGLQHLKIIDRSVLRMREVIDNLADLTRGRLGAGIQLKLRVEDNIKATLSQVIDDLRGSWPWHEITVDFPSVVPFVCDTRRIGQLLSNLLANALAYGDATKPVRVSAESDAGEFSICVTNQGEPISAEAARTLFEPFFRKAVRKGEAGVGLGLYVADLIAKAHRGQISVHSDDQETRFCFTMPVLPFQRQEFIEQATNR